MDILAATLSGELNHKKVEKRKWALGNKENSAKSFMATLDEMGESNEAKKLDDTDKALENLLDEVFSLGEKLKKDHALHCLTNYRQSVKTLLNYVLDTAYRQEEVKGVINRHTMTQKRHSVIRIVDEKLDQLARLVISEQQQTFALLAKVNEINGLLVNIWR
jgi:uncharacterized protein YaaR (DUF327 family)